MLFGEWSSEPLCPVSVASGGRVLQDTRPLRMMRFGPTGFKTICGALANRRATDTLLKLFLTDPQTGTLLPTGLVKFANVIERLTHFVYPI
jgi:hypothetical protein